MKQTCLCEYLGTTCNHPDTFLRLPFSIRRRIYLYAGLVTGALVSYPDLTQLESDDRKVPHENFVITHSLANVCRQTRSEVEGVLLDENTCVYHRDTIDEGLDHLSRLSPFACSMLRDVYVHLWLRRRTGCYGFEKPLSWERIAMWQLAVTHILTHARPRRLRLHLICETAYSKKTTAVLQPLQRFPGLLLELELRLAELGQCEDNKMWNLARETALQVQGPVADASSGAFRFLDLPPEIRRHIYSYTNLVQPHRKVDWDPVRGFTFSYIYCECDGSVCQEEDLHNAYATSEGCGAYSKAGDFCTHDYASYSARCKHKMSPLSLLLVSRAMHAEALDYFYANNRIVISPHRLHIQDVVFAAANQTAGNQMSGSNNNQPDAMDVCDPSGDGNLTVYDENGYTWTRYMLRDSTKLFLDKIGPTGARMLRNIEIVFPRILPGSSLLATDPAYSEWCSAVEYLASLRSQGYVPDLTLIVHIWAAVPVPSGRTRQSPVPDEYEMAWNWSREQIDDFRCRRTAHILDEQAPRLLEPLRAIPQLNRLFVHLEWPLHWSSPKLQHDIATSKIPKKPSPGCGIGYHRYFDSIGSLVAKEAQLERLVMGAGYDSFSVGKGNEVPSPWVRNLWDMWL